MRTNFTIPDVHSIALGGGSMVRIGSARTSVGPDSVGSRLEEEGIAFGGKTLTVGDILWSDMHCSSHRTLRVGGQRNTANPRHRKRIHSLNLNIHPSALAIISRSPVICRVMFPFV